VVTGTVANEIDGLRRALGARALERIAPHCTLIPPVNVRAESLEAVLSNVRAAARKSAPIAVNLGPLATFWPRTPVLYLAVGGDLDAMTVLRDNLGVGPLPHRRRAPNATSYRTSPSTNASSPVGCLTRWRRWPIIERLTVSSAVTVLEQDADHRWQPLADAALGTPVVAGRGSLDLEVSVVDRPDPVVAAWADEQWASYSRERYGDAVRPITPYALVARADDRSRRVCRRRDPGPGPADRPVDRQP